MNNIWVIYLYLLSTIFSIVTVEADFNEIALVKNISPANLNLTQQGYLTEASAKSLLERAFAQGALADPAFRSGSCFLVNDIISAKGFQTLQLFLISSTCTHETKDFIFKEIASGLKEIENLVLSLAIPGLSSYVYPNDVAHFPLFFFPVSYLSYKYNDKTHYMSILPRAPGVLTSTYISKYKNGEISANRINNIFYNIGLSLSNFHKEFMPRYRDSTSKTILTPTIIHGDLHQENVFFDEETTRMSAIDNERMFAWSPRSPIDDISWFFLVTLNVFTPDPLKNDHAFIIDWLKLTLNSFLSGYTSIYPPDQKELVLDEIYQGLKASEHYKKNEHIVDDVIRQLKSKNTWDDLTST